MNKTTGMVTLDTLSRSVLMLFGTSNKNLLPFFLLFILLGIVRFVRRYPNLGLPLFLVLTVPSIFYSILRPHSIEAAPVFLRYQAPLIPIYLLLSVYGWGVLRRNIANRVTILRLFPFFIGIGLITVITILGPFRYGIPPYYPYGLFSFFTRGPGIETEIRDIPPFYNQHNQNAPPVIIEAPADSKFRLLFMKYQTIHKGRVIRFFPSSWSHHGLKFKTIHFSLSSIAINAPKGAFFVLHRDLQKEQQEKLNVWASHGRFTTSDMIKIYYEEAKKKFGNPIYEDEFLWVFKT
jgi:hypothetical protein